MADVAVHDVEIQPVAAGAVRPLRLAVLRPHQPPKSAVYPGDDEPSTLHLGAHTEGEIVGIASLYAERRVDGPVPAWRLRGMATAPDVRGAGVGGALLRACMDYVAARGGGELWCNARLSASGFYARYEFEVVSDEFEVEGIGPHLVMRRSIPAA